MVHDGSQEPEVLPHNVHVWTRRDKKAKVFMTTLSGGPEWKQVFRRVTTDAETGEVLEDDPTIGDKAVSYTHLTLPTNREV